MMDIQRGTFEVVASHQICDKYGAPVAYTFREDDADLYGSAPDMLDALYRIANPGKGISQKAPAWAVGIANAAIRKAKGLGQ